MNMSEPCRRRRLHAVSALCLLLGALIFPPLAPSTAAVDPGAPTMVFGSYVERRGTQTEAEALTAFEQTIGRTLGTVRVFERWDSQFPTAEHDWLRDNGRPILLSVRAMYSNGTHIPWADIAAAKPGSALHSQMVGWARAVKDYGAPVIFSFNQEPELASNLANGTDADFKAAWRAFVTVFRDQGVSNVRHMWITTGHAFNISSSDRRYAPRWYPGDAYVDLMGIDVYNWHTCRTGVNTEWKSLATLMDGFRLFGLQHPQKGLWLAEWGSAEDPAMPGRKAQWISDARALLKGDAYAQFQGISYFHKTYDDETQRCNWSVDSSESALAAFTAMANDPFYGAPYVAPPPIEPPPPPAEVTYVGGAASNRNSTVHSVTVPTKVEAGDALVLFDTINNTSYVESAPSGWTLEGTTTVNGARTRVWSRTATAGSAGSAVSLTVSGSAMVSLQLLAYAGTDPVDPVLVSAGASETVSRAAHTTPTISGVPLGATVLSYWTDKSVGTTGWAVPAGQTLRGQSAGTGAGHLTHLATDARMQTSGPAGGVTATASTADARAMMWTLALAPEAVEPPPEEPPSAIAYVGGATSNRNASSHTVVVPAAVRAGDTLLLFDSINNTTYAESAPSGWTLRGTVTVNGARTRVWSRVADAASAGSSVLLTTSGTSMVSLQLLAYTATGADHLPVVAGAAETVNRATHTTPTVTAVPVGSTVVSYWVDKSAATTAWTAPDGQAVRGQSAGTGSGHLSHRATDAPSAGSGTDGGRTATANSSSARATMWTVVLTPGG
jgi:hypothetical protein